MGSHTVFFCEVTDAVKTSNFEPVTYAYYQLELKPKVSIDSSRKIKAWRCKICSYVYEGEVLPENFSCPLCGHDRSDFEPVYE